MIEIKSKNMAKSKNRSLKTSLIVIAIIAFVVIQFPTLIAEPWETFASWRQTDTYSVAVNYVQYNMNPLLPQFNYDGVSENYMQLELQIMPYLSAIIFKLFNIMTPFVPRLISLMFFIGSALFLFGILERRCSFFASFVGFLIYMAMPISLAYARTIMPESTALFFLCGGLYYLIKWMDLDDNKFLWLACIMTSFAIMQKIPVVFVGLVFAYVFFYKKGKKLFTDPLTYVAMTIILLPPIAYYMYSGHVSKFDFVSGIATKHIFTEKLFSFFTPESMEFFSHNLPMLFGEVVLAISILGFMISFFKKYHFFLFWAIAFLLESMTIVAIIKFDYYLIFLAPLFASLVAITINEMFNRQKLISGIVAFASIFFTLNTGYEYFQETLILDEFIGNVGKTIEEQIPFEDSIAINSFSPAYLNVANRRGYRANLHYYDYIPSDPQGEIDYFIENGVKWFIVLNGYMSGENGNEYLALIQSNYNVHYDDSICTIYILQ